MRLRPPSRGTVLALAATALAAVTVPSRAPAQSGSLFPEQLRTIADVQFRGLHHLGHRELKGANLKTRPPSRLPWKDRPSLRPDYLSADTAAIAQLYRHYGFLDARASWTLEPTHDPHATRVVFTIDEGRRSRISRVTFSGVTVFHEKELRRAVLAQRGRPFDPAFLPLDTLKLSTLYQERGYKPHTLATAERDSLAIHVDYAITEGGPYHLGTIAYEGGPHVRENLGRRELLVHPGDLYRRSRIELSVERLYGTGLFSQVQVTPFPDSTAGRMDLDFRIAERKSRWVDAGVGSGTQERFRVTGEWGHRNLDTRALAGQLDGEYAFNGRGQFSRRFASFTLTEPWLLGIRLLGQAKPYYDEFDDRTQPHLVLHTDKRGVELGLARDFSRIFRATLTGSHEFVHQSFGLDTIPTPTQEQAIRDSTFSHFATNRLISTFLRDTRDNRVTPGRGSLETIVGELAGGPLKGQSSYRKAQFSSVWYSPLPNGWTLATRAAGGMMDPVGQPPVQFTPGTSDDHVARVPRDSRFFLGGVNSLRGWGENQIPSDGGLAMVLANAELRIPLLGPFGAEAYVDAGNVWARPEYIRAADFITPWQAPRARVNDLRYVYGVGARLVLPFGPLRMDVTWSDRPDFPRSPLGGTRMPFAYQFAIGPSF